MTSHEVFAPFDQIVLYGGTATLVLTLAWLAHRRRDPLRGSPLRPNQIDPVAVLTLFMFYLFTLSLLDALAKQWMPDVPDNALSAPLRQAVVQPFVSLITGLACLFVGRQSFRAGLRGFGIGRRPVWRDVGFACFALIAAWPAVFGLHELSIMVLTHFRPDFEPPTHGVIQLLHEAGAPASVKAWLIAGAFVAAPFAEETFFRGILQTFVRKLLRSRWAAILTTGLIFGLIHGVQPQAILPLSLLGCVLGFAYERTGSLVCPMIIHALFNGRTLLYQMLGTSG